jgi:hypothetical protein
MENIALMCAGGVIVMVLSERPDAVKYIRRMMCFRAGQLPFNCLYIACTCIVHRVHRMIAKATDEDDHVGNTHAISFVSREKTKKTDIFQACLTLLADELVVIQGLEPPADVARHTQEVLRHTLERRHCITRARRDKDGSTPVRGVSAITKRRELCSAFLNSDIRGSTVVHYERGCCVNGEGQFCRAVCVSNMGAAIRSAGLLGDAVEGDPSKNRRGSQVEHDAAQLGGEMFWHIHARRWL